MESEQDEGWISLKEAARLLALSEKTLRKRIKTGELQSRQISTRFGLAYQVRVEDSKVVSRVEGQGSPDGESATTLELIRLVDRLQQENRKQAQESQDLLVQRAEAAAMWQARAEILSHEFSNAKAQLEQAQLQLAEAQATIRMLEAPKHEGTVVPTQPESLQEEPETAENREVVAEAGPEHREPWWRRFWQLVSV